MRTMNKKVCPECNCNLFHKDIYKQELSCTACGLILVAPSVHGLVFPGFKVVPHRKSLKVKINYIRKINFTVAYKLH